jgi:hypothetical protein
VALLDAETVGDFLAEEIPAALAFCQAMGLPAEWDAVMRVLSVGFTGASNTGAEPEDYQLVGTFEDYRVVPPTWRFVDPRNGATVGQAAIPAGNIPGGSVFHTNGIICAPWSRDAYGDRGGPHADWPDATKWQTTAPQHSQAKTIADMLARIYAEVQTSPGRMAPLPPLAREEAA